MAQPQRKIENEHNLAAQDAVIEQIEISAPAQIVWDAITDPRQILQWWQEKDIAPIVSWDHELKIGGQLSARWSGSTGKAYLLKGTYLEVDPPKALAYSWESDWVDCGSISQVRWELLPTVKGTLLTVTHSGLRGYPEAVKDFGGGWPKVLRNLGEFISRSADKSAQRK